MLKGLLRLLRVADLRWCHLQLLGMVQRGMMHLGKEFREAVDEENFGWLMKTGRDWEKRNDLLDDVIAKGADFTVRFIQNVGDAKACTCCTL